MTGGMKPEARERLEKMVPVGRMGSPEEIAQTAKFIFENDYVNAWFSRLMAESLCKQTYFHRTKGTLLACLTLFTTYSGNWGHHHLQVVSK